MTINRRTSVPPTWASPTIETKPLWTAPGTFAYDLWKNVSIGVYVGQATAAAARELLAMSNQQARFFPEGRSSVVFVLDQLPAPAAEARPDLDRVYESSGLACTAIVLEGSGFWASAIRSMTSNMVRGQPVTVRAHTNVDEVIAWLPAEHQKRTKVELPPDDLKRALAFARKACELRARG
jgi:hypothetical protein